LVGIVGPLVCTDHSALTSKKEEKEKITSIRTVYNIIFSIRITWIIQGYLASLVVPKMVEDRKLYCRNNYNNNWILKFSGKGSLSIDLFLHRVEAVALQTLNGGLDLLAAFASNLFEGTASEWCWRYHKNIR